MTVKIANSIPPGSVSRMPDDARFGRQEEGLCGTGGVAPNQRARNTAEKDCKRSVKTT